MATLWPWLMVWLAAATAQTLSGTELTTDGHVTVLATTPALLEEGARKRVVLTTDDGPLQGSSNADGALHTYGALLQDDNPRYSAQQIESGSLQEGGRKHVVLTVGDRISLDDDGYYLQTKGDERMQNDDNRNGGESASKKMKNVKNYEYLYNDDSDVHYGKINHDNYYLDYISGNTLDRSDRIQASKARTTNTINVVNNRDETNETRVQMCCDANHVFNMTVMQCEQSDQVIQPVFHDQWQRQVTGSVVHTTVHNIPNCTLYALSPSTAGLQDHFTLQLDGSLAVGGQEGEPFRVVAGRYCLLFPEPDLMEALVCFPEQDTHAQSKLDRLHFQRTVYPVCLAVSSTFLGLTLFVYCVLKQLREDLLSKCFMCTIAMLMTGQVVMVATQWGINSLIHTPLCVMLGSLSHFSLLSTFLWLNAMSCIVFRSLWYPGSNSGWCGRVNLLWWGAYAWGVAAVVAGVALLRDLLPVLWGSALPAPRFATVACWFSNSPALVVYLLGPVALLLCINVTLFCLAAYRLRILLHKHPQRAAMNFGHYLKLFVLMGISWIFEVISFFVDAAYGDSPLNYIWVVLDLFNALQGVLIFLVFVCRPGVLRHLAAKVCGVHCAVRYLGASAADNKDKEETEVAPCNTVV